jgi:hypothetical protein
MLNVPAQPAIFSIQIFSGSINHWGFSTVWAEKFSQKR